MSEKHKWPAKPCQDWRATGLKTSTDYTPESCNQISLPGLSHSIWSSGRPDDQDCERIHHTDIDYYNSVIDSDSNSLFPVT